MDAAEAHELAALAKTCGRFLMEAMWTKFLPLHNAVKAMIQKGEIGDLQLVSPDSILEKTLPILKMALRPFRLDLQLDSKNAFTKVEPHLLQQVFFNIINN
jgi:K+-sensing histidine kinase KdpD